MATELHGAVPIDLSYLRSGEDGAPERVNERHYVYYNNHSVDRFQREAGIELSELADEDEPNAEELSEEEQDAQVQERLQKLLKANDLSAVRFASILLWSGLIWADPDLTIDEAGQKIQAHDLERVYEATNEAFENYAQGSQNLREASGNAKAGASRGPRPANEQR